MNPIQLNDFVLSLRQKYDCTQKADSISRLSAIDRAYYIDDINYMSIADDVYTFWPLGQGCADLFFYVRHFKEKTIDTLLLPSYYSIHISTQSAHGIDEILNLLGPIHDGAKEITINAPPYVDVCRILSHTDNNRPLSICQRYVPTSETYRLPDLPVLSMRPHSDASFESICQTHPEILPCYHPNSVLEQLIRNNGLHAVDNITLEIDGYASDFWTLFENEQPILSLIPNVYDIGMMGFMHHHMLYKNDVSQDLIDFALKSLCCIYQKRGLIIRTVAVFDNDPFESAKTLKRIGMVNDYQFVRIYSNKRKR